MTDTATDSPAVVAEPEPTAHLRRIVLDVALVDGQQGQVVVTNPDLIRWDLTRARRDWPSLGQALFLGNTFLAWAALKRQGSPLVGADDFDDWQGRVELVQDAPSRSGAAVPPSPPAPEAG